MGETLEQLKAEAEVLYNKDKVTQRDWARLRLLWERIARLKRIEQEASA